MKKQLPEIVVRSHGLKAPLLLVPAIIDRRCLCVNALRAHGL
ncbi:hypothetical protein AVMA1855_24000 [Acidovorax sp. SUPP1855]|nr:hypothetical protein AVMA1855_24000 [Acidovorax sp. SUPP1855]